MCLDLVYAVNNDTVYVQKRHSSTSRETLELLDTRTHKRRRRKGTFLAFFRKGVQRRKLKVGTGTGVLWGVLGYVYM